MLSATGQGMRDLGSFKSRVANDFAKGRISREDMILITEHIDIIESKLVEIISNDRRRQEQDDRPISVPTTPAA